MLMREPEAHGATPTAQQTQADLSGGACVLTMWLFVWSLLSTPGSTPHSTPTPSLASHCPVLLARAPCCVWKSLMNSRGLWLSACSLQSPGVRALKGSLVQPRKAVS